MGCHERGGEGGNSMGGGVRGMRPDSIFTHVGIYICREGERGSLCV